MALLTRTNLRINRYCSMANFQFLKWRPFAILDFFKVKNFNFRSGSEGQCASSCQISWRSVEPFRRYGRFSIFKMAAVRHLGFVLRVGTTHEEYLVVFVTVQNLIVIYSKFHRNPFRGFGARGGQNLAFPITLAIGFYNSLYNRTSRGILYSMSFSITF